MLVINASKHTGNPEGNSDDFQRWQQDVIK